MKKIGDTVARNWNIPLDIFYGNKTEKSTGNEDFITFAISPYFKILEDGVNISLIGKKDYLKGEYARFNRMNINHRDISRDKHGRSYRSGRQILQRICQNRIKNCGQHRYHELQR